MMQAEALLRGGGVAGLQRDVALEEVELQRIPESWPVGPPAA
jgi:hypothetical protein